MGETVGARVSNTLRNRIDTYADQHDLSRSEAIEVLLKNGLGDDVEPEPSLYQQMQQLRDDLEDIDDRVSRLEANPLVRFLRRL